MRIAVFCVDPIYSEALACWLNQTGGHKVVSCISHLGSASEMIVAQAPDLLLFTDEFDDVASRNSLRELRASHPVHTMLLHSRRSGTASPEFDISVSRWTGVSALLTALNSLSHEPTLAVDLGPAEYSEDRAPSPFPRLQAMTVRERETAELVAQGLNNRQIAQRLSLSETTVKQYVSRLIRANGCSNRVQLALAMTSQRPEKARV